MLPTGDVDEVEPGPLVAFCLRHVVKLELRWTVGILREEPRAKLELLRHGRNVNVAVLVLSEFLDEVVFSLVFFSEIRDPVTVFLHDDAQSFALLDDARIQLLLAGLVVVLGRLLDRAFRARFQRGCDESLSLRCSLQELEFGG